MNLAISCAKEAKTPYGALIVNTHSGKFIKEANTTSSGDKTEHAEMNALRSLPNLAFEDKKDLILYSTAEPCPMCMGAILWSGITRVKYGVDIEFIQNFHHQIEIKAETIANQSWLSCEISEGLEIEQCRALFESFA